jgi:hypothetical protein
MQKSRGLLRNYENIPFCGKQMFLPFDSRLFHTKVLPCLLLPVPFNTMTPLPTTLIIYTKYGKKRTADI